MQASQSYEAILQTSLRVNWRVEDIIGGDKRLDFTKPFLPETFARTGRLPFLTPAERLTLNHIRAHGYLAMFGLVEEFILPFIVDHSGAGTDGDDYRVRAMLQFAGEEAKHIQLFKQFKTEFVASFGTPCGFIGPAHEISKEILRHDPLAVAIAVLGIEWMSQGHYVESIKDDQELDVQFKSLLRHHWIEEAQHAKLDALLVRSMAAASTPADIDRAVGEYLEIGMFIDGGLKQLAALDLEAFGQATGRKLSESERTQFLDVQHQALRWTFLGSAMRNANFLAALGELGGDARARIEDVAPAFC